MTTVKLDNKAMTLLAAKLVDDSLANLLVEQYGARWKETASDVDIMEASILWLGAAAYTLGVVISGVNPKPGFRDQLLSSITRGITARANHVDIHQTISTHLH